MAKTKFSVDFRGFLDLAKQVDEMGGGFLKKATESALIKSKEYVHQEIERALEASPYNFKGTGRSHGTTRKSAEKVAEMPLTWSGSVATEYVGVSWYDAPEATLLAFGTPHIEGDARLRNALKVKGKVAKEVKAIQKAEFERILKEAGNG